MSPEEMVHRLADELKRRFKEAGRGTIQKITEELDVDRRYFLTWAQKGGPVIRLAQAVSRLNVDYRHFFSAALGSLTTEETIRVYLMSSTPKPKMLDSIESFVNCDLSAPVEKKERSILEELELLRYSEPKKVITQAEEIIKGEKFFAKPFLLGIAATAYWHLTEFGSAKWALTAALQGWGKSASVRADIYCRAAPVLVFEGQHAAGLFVAERAIIDSFLAGIPEKAGRGLVNAGLALFHLGRLEEAEEAQKEALNLLEPNDHRHRFSAFQAIGLYRHERGDLESAMGYVIKAKQIPMVPLHLSASLSWLQGRIAIGLRDPRLAEACFGDVLNIYLPEKGVASPANAAIVGCELVQSQIAQNKFNEARITARTLNRVAIALAGDHEPVAKALLELAYCEKLSGQLAQATIDKVKGRLEPRTPACKFIYKMIYLSKYILRLLRTSWNCVWAKSDGPSARYGMGSEGTLRQFRSWNRRSGFHEATWNDMWLKAMC